MLPDKRFKSDSGIGSVILTFRKGNQKNKMNTSNKFGFLCLKVHSVFIVIIAIFISLYIKYEPEAMFIWFFPIAIDYPISLILTKLSFQDYLPYQLFPGFIGNIPNFIAPLIFFLTFGNLWWFFLGKTVNLLFNGVKQKWNSI